MKTVLAPQLIEIINGSLFALHVLLSCFFASYVRQRFLAHRKNWRKAYRGAEGAIAVLMLELGSAMVRGAFWYLRHLQNDGIDTAHIDTPMAWIAVAGAIVTFAGGLCVVRVFMPVKYGPWPFILTALVTLAFGFGFGL